MIRSTAALFIAIAPAVAAYPDLPLHIPNGTINQCANCHQDPGGGGPRNPFGTAFAASGLVWNPEVAALDSDADGFTNGQELQDVAGAWVVDQPAAGDARLVSSPGFAFSTPGERAIQLSEIWLGPGTQRIELQNTLPEPVDVGGLVLRASSGEFILPSEVIPADEQLIIRLNSRGSFSPGIDEPPGSGLPALSTTGALSLFWIDHPFEEISHTLTDHLQWGSAGQRFETTAVGAAQWEEGTAAAAPGSGESLSHAAYGDRAQAWSITAANTLDAPNALYPAEQAAQVVLALRTSAEAASPDANGDGAVDAQDIVLRVNEGS